MVRRRFFLTMAGAAAILRAGDPWTAADVRQPSSLAKQLRDGMKPLVLYVGFPVLYKAAHIPGAVLAGPGSKQTGLDVMQAALSGVAKDREIVLYCGCCPFDRCPNIRLAFEKIRESGYTNVTLVMMPTNFHTDWVEPGYPVEKAS
jgi:thiosulfate/3-mercaptopyruvate sulfurtransferase